MVEAEKERIINSIAESVSLFCEKLNLNIRWIQELAIEIGTEAIEKEAFSKRELENLDSVIGTSIYESVIDRPQWRSLKDIAEVVGVSKGTLSNRHKKMKKVSREVIEKWNYRLQIGRVLSEIAELQRDKIFHIQSVWKLARRENKLIAKFNELADTAKRIEIITDQEEELVLEKAEIEETETFKGFHLFVEETDFTGHQAKGTVVKIPIIDIERIKEIKVVEWKEEK